MKLSRFGRISMALVVSVAMGLGMTACGGGTIAYMWVLGTQYNQIAGFKVDDIILKFEGKSVSGLEELSDAVKGKKPGDEVSIEIRRGRQTRTLKVKLEKRPD